MAECGFSAIGFREGTRETKRAGWSSRSVVGGPVRLPAFPGTLRSLIKSIVLTYYFFNILLESRGNCT
ncbi:hypothetical protein AMJ96_CH03590 [Rhizobium sp. N113]|nr:hypothetical protein AMJ96_CH03590 [Rhizobium sp. N113]